MDPYISGLIVGIAFGGSIGVLAMGICSSSGPITDQMDAEDAERFRALRDNATNSSSDDGVKASLTELADEIRSARVRRGLA